MDKNRYKFFKEYFKTKFGPKSEVFEQYVKETENRLFQRATNVLSLNQELFKDKNLIVVYEPKQLDKNSDVRYKVLGDVKDINAKIIYNQVRYTYIFFGNHRLFYYIVDVDLRYNYATNDTFGSIAYNDIAGIEMRYSLDSVMKPLFEKVELKLNVLQNPFYLTIRNRLYTGNHQEFTMSIQEKTVFDALHQVVRR